MNIDFVGTKWASRRYKVETPFNNKVKDIIRILESSTDFLFGIPIDEQMWF